MTFSRRALIAALAAASLIGVADAADTPSKSSNDAAMTNQKQQVVDLLKSI